MTGPAPARLVMALLAGGLLLVAGIPPLGADETEQRVADVTVAAGDTVAAAADPTIDTTSAVADSTAAADSLLAAGLAPVTGTDSASLDPATVPLDSLFAVIETERGEIRVELHAEAAPLAVANFVNLAARGFYDGLTFHRVHQGQFIQGGSPTGESTGGPGYVFDNEFAGGLSHSCAGTVSMAGGPNGNGCQFFITLDACPYLDGIHTLFGQVVEGMAAVEAIQPGDRMRRVSIAGDPAPLFARLRDRLAEWNGILDQPATN